MQNYKKRASHGSQSEKALSEIRDSLLNDVIDFRQNVTFVGAFFIGIRNNFRYAERIGVEWRLGDETIWKRNPEEACYAGCEAQEENIPVKTCRFAEGELSSLGDK